MVLEAGTPRSRCQHDSELQIADFPYFHMVEEGLAISLALSKGTV